MFQNTQAFARATVAASCLAITTTAVAAVPHTFQDGDLVSADEMNDNFDVLDDDLDAVAAAVSAVPAMVGVRFSGDGSVYEYVGPGSATVETHLDDSAVRITFTADTFSAQPVCVATWAQNSGQMLAAYTVPKETTDGTWAYDVQCVVIGGLEAPRDCRGTNNLHAMICVAPQ